MEHFGPFALSSGERRHVWHHVWSCASFTARAFLCEHTDVRLGEANKSLRVVSSASSLRVFLNPDTENCGCGKSKWPEQLSALDLHSAPRLVDLSEKRLLLIVSLLSLGDELVLFLSDRRQLSLHI